MRLRNPFRSDWRRRPPVDPDVIDFETPYPLTVRTWRQVGATWRIVRHGWPGFSYDASAQAVGTLVAIAIAYLFSLAVGLVNAVPAAVVGSLLVVAGVVVAAFFRLAPRQLLRARATELLDAEPARIVETMKKIFASPRFPNVRLDIPGKWGIADSDFQILDALWELPERERTIIAVRFGVPMTLADISDALGLSRERIRQLESQAIARVAAYVEERQSHESEEIGDMNEEGSNP
jgi:hypothetical protein